MKKALAFSGGKDSWACLWCYKDELANIEVLWVNTGKNYPEIIETISAAKKICPNFKEIIVDRDGQNAANGLPADVVPINWTTYGQQFTGLKLTKIQSYLQCCHENISANLMDVCKKIGVTHLIRGERHAERYKSTAKNGDIVDGIELIHPIENWSEKEVLSFIAQHMPLPEHFKFKHSSMDCYDCTAYNADSKDRVAFMRKAHPVLFKDYDRRMSSVKKVLKESLKDLE